MQFVVETGQPNIQDGPALSGSSVGGQSSQGRKASASPTKRRSPMTPYTKMLAVLKAIKELDMTFGDFLYEAFKVTDDTTGEPIERDVGHSTTVGIFLSGSAHHTFGDIVGQILENPGAKIGKKHAEWNDRYSPTKPSTEIRAAEPYLTTLAVELVTKQLVEELKILVDGSTGLHGSLKHDEKGSHKKLQWTDISPTTVDFVTKTLAANAPLAMHFALQMATPAPSPNKDGVRAIRAKQRPPSLAATETLSILAYSRSPAARLLPHARALFFFACGAPEILFRYGNRVSLLPSWNTTIKTLKDLAAVNARQLKVIGTDLSRGLVTRCDNVQTYIKPHEQRIGRETYMNIGLAATAWEAFDYTPAATDISDKQARLGSNLRAKLTVSDLLDMIDVDHIEKVGTFQWLQTLTRYVPQLARYRADVTELYRTEAAKFRLPVQPSIGHPMSTVAKNENITTEFRDALNDFLNQLGQSDESHQSRLHFIGGDGLTYERLIFMKRLQRHQSNEFRRLDIVQPFLEMWHTEWTYVSTIFEGHYGSALSNDPSTIGHNMSKINQKPVNNVKKVDYYPATYSAYLILDCRMLDCWRIDFQTDDLFAYFDELERTNSLPTLQHLRERAVVLYQRYSSTKAYHAARTGHMHTHDVMLPRGSSWTPLSTDESTGDNNMEEDEPFCGDQALAQSIAFMRDTILSREAAQAVGDGDPGRLYEIIKMMIFYFAGSSHSKYVYYLLETLADIELESSKEYKDYYLRNILLNPSGQPGRFQEGDLTQKHYNKELETYIGRKDAQWDSEFLRNVISPNVHHFSMLKNTWGDGVGLEKRRTTHTAPHSKPEVRILLQIFREEDLHRFRTGRLYETSSKDVDMFAKGIDNLESKKLRKWISDSTRARQTPTEQAELESGDDEDGEEAEDAQPASRATNGGMAMINGELIISIDDSQWEKELEAAERELRKLIDGEVLETINENL